MAHQYAKIAFTKTVRQVQSEQNSRSGYASMDVGADYNYLLSQAEADFIAQRDSFYMASVSETNWPYVQHRGGAKGFLKVIDENTLGFADFKGNRQYVSTGNFRTNDRVSIILMDYPNRRRLKILGHISLVDEQDWQTLALLEDDSYRATVERGFIIKLDAFDWNCPQHITPRYNEAELSALIDPLQQKVDILTAQLADNKPQQAIKALGDGELALVISGVRQLTPEIRAYELRALDGEALPVISAGSHIKVPVQLADKKIVWRHYSISSNPSRTDCYEISVKKESHGRGGSQAIHQIYQLGLILNCPLPENFFPLVESTQHTVLIAAGIGITPIKSMALALLQNNASFEVHYAGRAIHQMAYRDRLIRQLDEKLHLYSSKEGSKLSLERLIQNTTPNTHYYFCGPNSMLNDFKKLALENGIPNENIHYEQFSSAVSTSAQACKLILKKSNLELEVSKDQSLLDAILAADINVPYSCKTGACKSCVIQVDSNSAIEHLDNCLTEQERAVGKMCLCVSRPTSKEITIDI
ncbi:2Fe-2S iron-sulfur cluster-binding protein [Colwelliaceae bacterium 6471]